MKTRTSANQTFYTVQKNSSTFYNVFDRWTSNDRKISTSWTKPFYYCIALVQIHIPLFPQGKTKQSCFNFKTQIPSCLWRSPRLQTSCPKPSSLPPSHQEHWGSSPSRRKLTAPTGAGEPCLAPALWPLWSGEPCENHLQWDAHLPGLLVSLIETRRPTWSFFWKWEEGGS